MLKVLFSLIVSLLVGTSIKASENMNMSDFASQELDSLILQFDMGAKWAQNQIKGVEHEPNLIELLQSAQRLVPFHGTTAGTGERTMMNLYRIEYPRDHILLLRAKKNRLQLLVGAPVSKDAMEIARRKSHYLLNEHGVGQDKLRALVGSIEAANKEIKERYGVSVLETKNSYDPFNPVFMQIEDKAALYMELDPNIAQERLRDFFTLLSWSTCSKLLLQIR